MFYFFPRKLKTKMDFVNWTLSSKGNPINTFQFNRNKFNIDPGNIEDLVLNDFFEDYGGDLEFQEEDVDKSDEPMLAIVLKNYFQEIQTKDVVGFPDIEESHEIFYNQLNNPDPDISYKSLEDQKKFFFENYKKDHDIFVANLMVSVAYSYINDLLQKCFKRELEKYFDFAQDIQPLGSGTYGKVYSLGKARGGQTEFVVKIQILGAHSKINDPKSKSKEIIDYMFHMFARAITVHSKINKVKLSNNMTSVAVPLFTKKPFWVCRIGTHSEQLRFGFIVMQKAVGWETLENRRNLDDSFFFNTYKTLLAKIDIFNEQGLALVDMKPENLLWIQNEKTNQMEVFLNDFDFVNNFNAGIMNSIIHCNSTFGLITPGIIKTAKFDKIQKRNIRPFMITAGQGRDAWLKENPFRIDYWIFQFFANCIESNKLYKELFVNFNNAKSEDAQQQRAKEMGRTYKKYPLIRPSQYDIFTMK
jgi:hypothetical protein